MSDTESVGNLDSLRINDAVESGTRVHKRSLFQPFRPSPAVREPAEVVPTLTGSHPLPSPLVPDNVDPTVLPPELRPREPAPYRMNSIQSQGSVDDTEYKGSVSMSESSTVSGEHISSETERHSVTSSDVQINVGVLGGHSEDNTEAASNASGSHDEPEPGHRTEDHQDIPDGAREDVQERGQAPCPERGQATCPMCNLLLPVGSVLEEHVEQHLENTRECPVCTKTFGKDQEEELEVHVQGHFEEEENLQQLHYRGWDLGID